MNIRLNYGGEMIEKKLEKIINDQINKELYSEYLYLSMAAYLYGIDLDGFAHWFEIQAQEEHQHAMKFFRFLIDRGGRVKLESIDKPQVEFKSVEEVCQLTLSHEEKVTASINNMMDMARESKDYPMISMLNWFVDEQVEEEATASRLLNRVKMLSDAKQSLFILDKELAQRGTGE
jgi:ferritin